MKKLCYLTIELILTFGFMNQPLESTKKMDWISVDCNENRQPA